MPDERRLEAVIETLEIVARHLRTYPGEPRVSLAQAGNIDETIRDIRKMLPCREESRDR